MVAPSARKQEQANSVVQDKHVQKQMERMEKARQEKERIKMFTERGEMPPVNREQVNESTITATSKRPGTNATRKSPRDTRANKG